VTRNIKSIKNLNDHIGNCTSDNMACSEVHQATAPRRGALFIVGHKEQISENRNYRILFPFNTLRTGLLNCLNARSRGLIQSEVRYL
jgi:hypothetical protein